MDQSGQRVCLTVETRCEWSECSIMKKKNHFLPFHTFVITHHFQLLFYLTILTHFSSHPSPPPLIWLPYSSVSRANRFPNNDTNDSCDYGVFAAP